jgi:hypothetical protein
MQANDEEIGLMLAKGLLHTRYTLAIRPRQ